MLKVSAMQNKELSYARVLSNLLDGYVGGEGENGDIYGLALLAGLSGLCSSEEKLPEIYGNTGKHVSSMAPDLSAGQKKTGMLVTSIREYLDREYCSKLVLLEATAEEFRKNPACISKVFKNETGFNFSDYITQKRMAHSKLLLRDMSLKIYEIAEMTGYADASNFIKVFKKHCGMSPNEYRGLHN